MGEINERKTLNQLALITGGSSGLGFAMAKQLAQEGYNLILLARNKDKLDCAVSDLQKSSSSVIGFQADITDQASLNVVADYLQKHNTKINFLILNAGIVLVNAVRDASSDDLKQVIDNDLYGSILSSKIFLPALDEKARVLFISSALGLVGAAGYGSYCAAKAGIINYAAVLRRELLGHASVYVACPADIDTPQYAAEKATMPDWMKRGNIRGKVLSADVVASKILKKCHGRTFLIMTNIDIYFLLLILPRFLPRSWFDWLVDRLLPRP